MRHLKIIKQITNREDQSLDKYFNEVARLSLITANDEVELAKKIRTGDHIALEKLTKANLRFVISVAKQFQNNGVFLGDLINEGNLGLIIAAKRFDETRGFKFISYAIWWIRRSIMQALADQSRTVRLPINRVGALKKVSRAISALEQTHHREPSNEELAEMLKLTVDEVADTLTFSGRQVSFDAPFAKGESNSLLDVIESNVEQPPDYGLMFESLQGEVKHLLSTLTQRQSDVLTFYFGLNGKQPMTLEEIAEKYSLTSEGVRQIKIKATLRLRQTEGCETLRAYLA